MNDEIYRKLRKIEIIIESLKGIFIVDCSSCGQPVDLLKRDEAFRCFHCHEVFCKICAEEHFEESNEKD